MTGGSMTYGASSGPMFYVTNAVGNITLSGVTLTTNSGVLVKAAAGSWGTSGSNGGTVILKATGQSMTGDMTADSISTITATLSGSSALTGAINAANTAESVALTLDSTSTWTLTGNSYITSLSDTSGLSGSTVTNIIGNGYNVYYDASASANSALGGGTYSLVNGGYLLPKGSSATTTCSYTASSSTTSFAAGGGTGTATVTTTSSCSWTAASDSTWLTITSGSSGTGSGTVAFTVAANTSTSSRTATITVAGKTITVMQAAASTVVDCSNLTLSSTTAAFDAAGGTRSLTLTIGSACSWSAASDSTWLTIASGTSGTGPGTVSFTATTNDSGATRTGTLTIGSSSVTVTQSTLGAQGLVFVPMTPCRLVDTRTAAGISGAQYAAGESRTISVSLGNCVVPTIAAAYSVNVTAIPASVLNYATLWPTGLPQPSTYTITSADGRTRSSGAIVASGTNGYIDLYSSDAADFVIDVNGYFVSPAVTTSGLLYHPITPCRLIDTRLATADLAGPSLSAGQTRVFTPSGACSLPTTTVQAYVMNIAVVPKTTLSNLAIWAYGQAQPELATISAPTGAVTSNSAVVAAGTYGTFNVYAAEETDVVIDVSGYFTTTDSGGYYYYTVTPCRLADTRSGTRMSAYETRAFSPMESTTCTVPTTAQAYALNATAVPATTLGYLTLWPTGVDQPVVATLNASDGTKTSNAAVIKAGTDGQFSAYTTNATQLIFDYTGYFAQ
jgi:hypothetical protein